MNRRQSELNEEESLPFAKSYLSEAFPNRERVDCPPASDLIFLAEHPRDADPAIGEHLSYCSPCFKDYMATLAYVRRRNASSAA